MFDKNFFPTPEHVVKGMIKDLKLNGKTILEPSAGKGDIVNVIQDKYDYTKCYCIEKNQQLRAILREDGHKVIDEDFLTYTPDMIFDYIIMNPPFSEGITHLKKAIEIGNGAEIRCLLNAENIRNPNTKEQKQFVGNLDLMGADVEYLGNCFSSSERPTNVDVALIKVQTEAVGSDFDFNIGFDTEEETVNFERFNKNEIVNANQITRVVDCYNAISNAMLEYLKVKRKLQHYSSTLIDKTDLDKMLKESSCTDLNKNLNHFMGNLKKKSWNIIFNKTKFQDKLTSTVKKDFDTFQKDTQNLAFTEENIMKLLQFLLVNKDNIFEKCIEKAFDEMTNYYPENRYYPEGWKTNSQWMVNRKFILPRVLDDWNVKWGGVSLTYSMRDQLDDLEKSLACLEGKDFNNCLSVTRVVKDNELKFGTWYESDYLMFKVFKKRTGHFKFKDEILWEKFNETACRYKKWIGNN